MNTILTYTHPLIGTCRAISYFFLSSSYVNWNWKQMNEKRNELCFFLFANIHSVDSYRKWRMVSTQIRQLYETMELNYTFYSSSSAWKLFFFVQWFLARIYTYLPQDWEKIRVFSFALVDFHLIFFFKQIQLDFKIYRFVASKTEFIIFFLFRLIW